MPRLRSLDLSGPSINPYYGNVGQQPLLDIGARAWVNSSNAKKLKRLRMRNCHLTDEALKAIFQSSKFQKLEQLELSHNSFTASAISQAVIGSPLWQTLEELGFNDCRLDNAAIEALSRVKHAPALRSLQLGYNSIGPKGAAALANWSMLARVWHLDLHDNVIGDEGLIALAKSPNLGHLLELDLEQDCWNSRTFSFNDRAAKALAKSRSLPRLDSLFSGCVDEYHGGAYSPGFTKSGLDVVRKSKWMRPVCKAACSDFSGVGEYIECGEFDEEVELSEQDFRRHPFTLNEKEAKASQHRLQQVGSTFGAKPAADDAKVPEIRPFLPELDFDNEDVIEGLAFRDPTPTTDISQTLDLSLEDRQRPLPNQVGKFISNTLRSIFHACSIGYFESSSAGAREGEDGRSIDTDVGFSVGIKGDPEVAVQLIRETLWWVGAPGDTDLEEFPLALTKKPKKAASRFLQLASQKIVRWNIGDESDHRIDRVPFSTAQRKRIQTILTKAHAADPVNGWVAATTTDGGHMVIYIKYLDDSAEFDTLNILIEELTPEISGLVHKLMQECAFMLLPMCSAASEEVAQSIDCDWPKVKVVDSAAALHELLARGPYHWWKHT